MLSSSVALLASGLLLFAAAAHAQESLPLPATAPLRFESWQPASPTPLRRTPMTDVVVEKNRTRQVITGGAIGAVAGFALCTAISTLVDDSADGGVSFCPLDTTLIFVGGGFAVGAAIGWAI
jgi:hypothetical protein